MVYPKPRITFAFVFKHHWKLVFVPIAFYTGKAIDEHFELKCTKFRDKSGLYGFQVKEGDPPSW